MSETVRIEIASPPDREKLVAQFMVGNEQWAELNQDSNVLKLEMYGKQSGEPWMMEFDKVIEVLKEGRRRLIGD